MISFMVAMAENRVIGKDNTLPWRLPADMAYFKRVTMGHPVIMGRKTFESMGGLLPGRENVIVTRDRNYVQEGAAILHSPEEIAAYAKDAGQEVFVIGGAEIFKETLPYADKMYITQIEHDFEGDTFFPEYDEAKWRLAASERGKEDDKNHYPHTFNVYERIKS